MGDVLFFRCAGASWLGAWKGQEAQPSPPHGATLTMPLTKHGGKWKNKIAELGWEPGPQVTQQQATWLGARTASHRFLSSSVPPSCMPGTPSVAFFPFVGIRGVYGISFCTGSCLSFWLGAEIHSPAPMPSIHPTWGVNCFRSLAVSLLAAGSRQNFPRERFVLVALPKTFDSSHGPIFLPLHHLLEIHRVICMFSVVLPVPMPDDVAVWWWILAESLVELVVRMLIERHPFRLDEKEFPNHFGGTQKPISG